MRQMRVILRRESNEGYIASRVESGLYSVVSQMRVIYSRESDQSYKAS